MGSQMAALVVKINQIIKQIQKIFSDDLSVFNGKKSIAFTQVIHMHIFGTNLINLSYGFYGQ